MNTSVSFELAKLLKEKGFSWECSHFYCKSKYDKKFYLTTGTEYESDRDCIWDWNLNGGKSGTLLKTIPYPNDKDAIYYSAPTIAEVVMWLYEKHGIWIYVDTSSVRKWVYFINLVDNDYFLNSDSTECGELYFNSPTEAYEAAIEHCLTKLKLDV